MKFSQALLLLSGFILLLSGCGEKKPGEAGSPEGSMDHSRPLSEDEIAEAVAYPHPLAEAYYQEFPDFFRQASPEDLPADLKWEDGMDQPEIGSPDAQKGGAVNLWRQDFPRTLRVVGPDSNNNFRSYIHDEMRIRLVHKHPATGGHYPGTCLAWAISEDKKTVYFKLDPAARFSDGVPVTADDYFFLFYFMRSPWLRAPWYEDWYHKKYTHITKYDAHTSAIGLVDAKPDPLRFIEEDVYPMPHYAYKDFSENFVEDYVWRFIPTTGAYVIHPEDIKKGRSITQTRIKDWWAKDKKFLRYRFNPDKRVFTVMRDKDKALEAFLAGEFHFWRVRVPEVWHDKLDAPNVRNGYIHRVQFYNQIPQPCYSLRINTTKPLLDNRDIRVGLNYATDWNLVIQQYFRGDYQRMQTSSDGYGPFTHPSLQARPFDVEKARDHFAKAGFTKRGPDGIFQNEAGRRLSFTITTGYKKYQDVLTILQQQARKAGVEYIPEVLDATSGWKKAQEKKHEIVFTALNRSVELYPRYFDFWHTYNALTSDGSPKPNTNNFTVTSQPEFDVLIDRYERSTDIDEIRQIAHQLEEMIYEQGSFVPGWVRPYYRVAHWRWIQYPEGFDYNLSREYDEMCTYWVDEALERETREALRTGKTFEPVTRIFDQNKTSS